jgi:nucleotidyltransferase-like protein
VSADELWALRERAKELRCLYDVSSAVERREDPPPAVFARVLAAIPPAWQFPEVTTARIEYLGRMHALPDFVDTPWRQRAAISIWRTTVGAVEVHYRVAKPDAWEGPFLKEERQLLDNIASRLGEYLEWKQRQLGGERIGAPPEHWRWRQRFAERLAASLDPHRFGVDGVWLFGSAEAGTAAPGSDIDLLVSFRGDERQRADLSSWLEGWSLCLGEIAFQLYGLPSHGLLNATLLSPAEAAERRAALTRGGAPPRELPLGPTARSRARPR